MGGLIGKRIVLGITGSIAAYKGAELVRRLREAGAQVQVVMTADATRFVTPMTFQALSGRTVRTELFDLDAEAAMGHIELARWAQVVLVAPASAHFMAQLAHGLAPDLLTTLCLATTASIVLAPAMNTLMWQNPATQANLETLKSRNLHITEPATGGQACGETGPGRMLEPEMIVRELTDLMAPGPLQDLTVLITAGPTREALDPVRVFTNRSSGRMGFALAAAAQAAGARVILISGPVSLPTPVNVTRIDVETALEMHAAVLAHARDCAILIACAAVTDYRPVRAASHKLKRSDQALHLELVPNPDIVAGVAALPDPPFILAFAAETERLVENARRKLIDKKVDLIAANDVGTKGLGLEAADNALEVFWADGQATLPRADKLTLAQQLIALLARRYQVRHAPAHA